MAKRYDPVGEEIHRLIQSIRDAWYEDLAGVAVAALFVSGEDGEPCLSHHGYPAAGLCRIVPPRDRAAGLPDAMIVLDAAIWANFTDKQQRALLDHELHHLERVYDKDGNTRDDAQGRPKLRIRKHTWNFGWFDEIAKRHGKASSEVTQAHLILHSSGQLYFDFAEDQAA